MDTKMKDETSFINRGSEPPPYSGPPGQSDPAHPEPASGYPGSGYPTTAQPQLGAPQRTGVHMTTVHPGNTTIIQGPNFVPVVVNTMGLDPATIVCKSCHQQVTTRTKRKPSMKTHLFAILLCVCLCWPCACLPYCINSCNNADHYCPNCNAYIGSYIG